MEKEKKTYLVQSQKYHESFGTIFWQWQSGPGSDPWKEKDPVKWTWQDYSYDDCRIIEQAFLFKKEIADLKEYEVDLKKMLQVNKKFRNRIRRVRRQEKSRFLMELSEPVTIAKDQKTVNEAFGTIQHFLNYIMKRTPEAYELYEKLRPLTLDSKYHEFEDIMKAVTTCIEKGAEAREKIIKTRSSPQATNFLLEAQQIVSLIRNSSAILGDFLKAVLKAYTMETFICYWLNELLRSEDWEEMNVLAPFLVCLIYTFQLSEFIIKYQKPQGFLPKLLGFAGKRRLYLYRGAALKKEHLEIYNMKNLKYFSWNGVTSTSRDEKVARNFIQFSLQKAKDMNESKVGVFFRIKIDFATSKDCEGMIDIFQNSCCQYPDEKEIILAPGTVFKLKNVRLIENGLHEIRLKVTREFDETKDNIKLLGTLQYKTIFQDQVLINGLSSQQSFKLLELLKGNKLIRKFEIRNSEIDDHLMEEIENLRVTTNMKREDVKLRYSTIIIGNLDFLVPYLQKANHVFTKNKIQFKEGNSNKCLKNRDWEPITLVLNEKTIERLQEKNQLKKLGEKIKEASQIAKIELSFDKYESTKDEYQYFLQCIKETKALQDIRLTIKDSYFVQGEYPVISYKAVSSSNKPNRLYSAFNLSNEGLILLEKALLPVAPLQQLSLEFNFFKMIFDEDINHLKTILLFKSLQNLSLGFQRCKEISDGGLNHLKSGLLSLTVVQHLSLDFRACDKISNEGLNHISTGLTSLTSPRSLQYLSLNFGECPKISDKGLDHLVSALIHLTSLQYLSLNFGECPKISDKGLHHLVSAIGPLTSLQDLSLNFAECPQISDKGLYHLVSAIRLLKSPHRLSLHFGECPQISDEGFHHLISAIGPLRSLYTLDLTFGGCPEISDKALHDLVSAIIQLTSLATLCLDFRECPKISYNGLDYLIKYLKSLTSLKYLSLHVPKEISEKGRDHLKSELRFIPKLYADLK